MKYNYITFFLVLFIYIYIYFNEARENDFLSKIKLIRSFEYNVLNRYTWENMKTVNTL